MKKTQQSILLMCILTVGLKKGLLRYWSSKLHQLCVFCSRIDQSYVLGSWESIPATLRPLCGFWCCSLSNKLMVTGALYFPPDFAQLFPISLFFSFLSIDCVYFKRKQQGKHYLQADILFFNLLICCLTCLYRFEKGVVRVLYEYMCFHSNVPSFTCQVDFLHIRK